MRKLIFLLCLLLAACGTVTPSRLFTVGIDPTVTWTVPTTDCTGAALPSGTVLTYNVYASPMPGGIPTLTTPATEIPCGARVLADRTKTTPLNTAPLAVTTFKTSLADGDWQIGVEAMNPAGTPSEVKTVTGTVKGRSAPAPTVSVGP